MLLSRSRGRLLLIFIMLASTEYKKRKNGAMDEGMKSGLTPCLRIDGISDIETSTKDRAGPRYNLQA
jgi:hypothetical protein